MYAIRSYYEAYSAEIEAVLVRYVLVIVSRKISGVKSGRGYSCVTVMPQKKLEVFLLLMGLLYIITGCCMP